ncbi:hypothetical protein SAMN04488054_12125 [Salibacterium qingdaonense]|uniref:Uncharacterized protein n=2 Tax=Salibacterium qingdaonense TaxID=266892 RepID=A0A1I4NXI7_9BACI|nr:hypothetical protein SAMN04488054_12125 [Salibacterium qingdaonense]
MRKWGESIGKMPMSARIDQETRGSIDKSGESIEKREHPRTGAGTCRVEAVTSRIEAENQRINAEMGRINRETPRIDRERGRINRENANEREN